MIDLLPMATKHPSGTRYELRQLPVKNLRTAIAAASSYEIDTPKLLSPLDFSIRIEEPLRINHKVKEYLITHCICRT